MPFATSTIINIMNEPMNTKKAFNQVREHLSNSESAKIIEQKSFSETFVFFNYLKLFEQEKYSKMVEIFAKEATLKKEMGQELQDVFSKVVEEISTKNKTRLENSLKFLESKKLSPQDINQEKSVSYKEFLIMNENDLRNDTRLRSAFAGNGRSLINAINFTKSSMLDLLRIDGKIIQKSEE